MHVSATSPLNPDPSSVTDQIGTNVSSSDQSATTPQEAPQQEDLFQETIGSSSLPPSTSATTSTAQPNFPSPSTSFPVPAPIPEQLTSMSESSGSVQATLPTVPYDPDSDIDPVTAVILQEQDELATKTDDDIPNIRCFACDTEKIKQCWLQAMRLAKVSNLLL